MDRKEIEEAVFHHKALLLCVNNSAAETSPYEAARFAWKVSRRRAEQAEVILAHRNGIIIGAFVAYARAIDIQGLPRGTEQTQCAAA